jgi:DnaK suppressor protein
MSPRIGSTSKTAKSAPAKSARSKASPRAAAPKAAAAKVPVAKAPAAKTPAPRVAVVKAQTAKSPAVRAAAPSLPPVTPAPEPRPLPPAGPVNRVTKKDHKHFEDRLLEERARLVKELGYLEANVLKQNQRDSSGDLSGYSFHMADLGTDAMEREKAFLFASAEGRALYDLDEALRRLYNGNYGVCESCGQPIARERLEVVPHARLCVRCKEREEKAGRR